MTKDEAIKKALESRPNNEVVEVHELEKCFLVCTLPKNYDEEENGLYVGGGVSVDKETGRCTIYNPFRDGFVRKVDDNGTNDISGE